MPNVQKQTAHHSKNAFTKGEIKKTAQESKSRDNLGGAFAGKENKGPSGYKMRDHSTNEKSRETRESQNREPKR